MSNEMKYYLKGSLFLADKIRKVKETAAMLLLGPILLCLPMALFCLQKEGDVTGIFVVSMLCCCLVNLAVGGELVLEYRLPYLIIDIRRYAVLMNTYNVISYLFMILTSGLITFLSGRFAFRDIMATGFGACILFCILCAWLVYSMKTTDEGEMENNGCLVWGWLCSCH